MFDIDFDHELFLRYIEDLQEHLFGSVTLDELFMDVKDHHQKLHLVTLNLLKDKETFYRYYHTKEERNIAWIFEIIIGTLTTNVTGDKIKEHLTDYLDLSTEMRSMNYEYNYDGKVFMKNLKSFMMYARKKKGVFNQADA